MTGDSVYRCSVMHRRYFPTRYRFSYSVFSLLLDIDAIDALARRLPLFSYNRVNLVSFQDRDHGPRDGSPLRPWLMALLAEHGVTGVDGRCLLLSMPRVFGYVFNPLSIFYCFDREEQLRAIVCEVKNTFSEQHCYVLHAHGRVLRFPVSQQRDKTFHVSPFLDLDGHYAFRFSAPADTLNIGIRHVNERGTQLVAVQRGTALACTAGNLLKLTLQTPLMTFKVITMIHWHALRLWLRKLPIHHHRRQADSVECLP